jgi:hypothetical protein
MDEPAQIPVPAFALMTVAFSMRNGKLSATTVLAREDSFVDNSAIIKRPGLAL